MQRGDIWIAAAGEIFASKPAPFIILQRDSTIEVRQSIMVCRLTTQVAELELLRPLLVPSETNGLEKPSRAQTDKVITLKKSSLTRCIGRVNDDDLKNIEAMIQFWLGL